MSYNHEGNTRQSNASHIERSVREFEVRLIPDTRHGVLQMHIIREQRLSRGCVRARNHPLVRSRTALRAFIRLSREPGATDPSTRIEISHFFYNRWRSLVFDLATPLRPRRMV